jgi:hypothetical protein
VDLNEDIDIRIKRSLVAQRELRGHRTRGHCALSAMLTVSQLSKSFAGRALFDDVSLQVPAKGNRIIQILSAIHYRFLGPNTR